MSNNGNGKPPLPFPGSAQIPLVGQPAEVLGWSLTVVVACKCEAGSLLLISGQPGANAQCPACGKRWGVGPGTKLHLELAHMLTAADRPTGLQPTP